MEKLRMETKDQTRANIELIAELFPNVITEMNDEHGKLRKGINFDLLRQELSGEIVSGEECYDFTWVGKRAAMVEANRKIRKTLRPVIEESKSWETTENLYIEGDNLDALKLLQESYLNSVKMIYIDPPYNTGNDSFVYADDFTMDMEDFEESIDYRDEEGNIQFRKNTETNPRFHSDWCSMIYPRLKLARNLLRDDGVIFISINDIELANLRQICNEIFGESNFVADLVWANKEGGGSSDSRLFRIKHEHILCFAKDIDSVDIQGVPVGNEDRYRFADEYVATRGKYYLQKMGMGTIQYSPSLDYPITAPDGTTIMPADNNGGRKACWRWSKPKYEWGVESGFIEIKKDRNGIWTVYSKQYLNCDNEGNIITRTQRPMGIIDEYSSTQAAKLLERMGLGSMFSYAKPVELLRYLCERVTSADDTVLDFFSGSATTAHAVMQLNADDGSKRKFIMVQLPEETDEQSAAARAGFKTIADIGKERIRRAGENIKEEIEGANQKLDDGEQPKKVPDIGFRVFKVDSTNMNDVYYAASEITQDLLTQMEANIKEDRTELDLLYSVLVDWGLPLSLRHTMETVDGVTVHTVDQGSLIACFAEHISEEVVREIAGRKPLRAVFRDSSFASSPGKINVTEIFKLLSPNTTVRVI
ncbi:MAG: site-specific DNA-methyltransferase [Firmicutes bacterium]|nr:site-specific DNA-methyltransferase [Bacillota bacterium]